VQPGYADLTGTFSGMGNGASLYVLVRPAGNSTWIVQDVPLIYVNGTYADHVDFDTQGNNNSQQFDLLAIITSTPSMQAIASRICQQHLHKTR
jgi:hypothetical protein